MQAVNELGLRIRHRSDGPEENGGGLSLPPRPLFELGQILITPNAEENLNPPDVRIALRRHRKGDFGEDDSESNARAFEGGKQIFSCYRDRKGIVFWIITAGDRLTTTIMLPEDH